ncbi:glutathione S-transferase alpha-4-like [Cervus canadensis]|uniref:glutathione S-transferase alpha-4-like n=1 Tax=Cervus canadensis TaxID=1574408 RepID=UPI001C9E6C0C|nr:glutathione S-transferase alpha-4-like [Cervus canadensis]
MEKKKFCFKQVLFPREESQEETRKPAVMEAKPKLWYFCGRGRMESIRWLLAAAGVEFEEEFLETREQHEKLQKDGRLLFGQVPLVEIDGMELTQTRAILSYLATKYNLHGKDPKETVRIDMYAEGTLDLMTMVALAAFKPPEGKEESLALVVKKAKTQHFPVFEKILKDHGEDFLVGNKFRWADIQLLEAILMVEELDASVLSDFPLLKEFKTRISNIPTIKKFLQPGSQRKPPPDSHYVEVVRNVLQF